MIVLSIDGYLVSKACFSSRFWRRSSNPSGMARTVLVIYSTTSIPCWNKTIEIELLMREDRKGQVWIFYVHKHKYNRKKINRKIKDWLFGIFTFPHFWAIAFKKNIKIGKNFLEKRNATSTLHFQARLGPVFCLKTYLKHSLASEPKFCIFRQQIDIVALIIHSTVNWNVWSSTIPF